MRFPNFTDPNRGNADFRFPGNPKIAKNPPAAYYLPCPPARLKNPTFPAEMRAGRKTENRKKNWAPAREGARFLVSRFRKLKLCAVEYLAGLAYQISKNL